LPTGSSREGFPNRVEKGGEAFSTFCGNRKDSPAGSGPECSQILSGFGKVAFVGGNEKGAFSESSIVKSELFAKKTIIFGGVSSVDPCGIDHKKKDRAPLDMAEKIVPQAFPFIGSFNQSGDIRKSEASFFRRSNYADVRSQSGEGVGGNFWAGCRKCSQEAGFSCIRKSDEADLGD
jgi:hypothetical protein